MLFIGLSKIIASSILRVSRESRGSKIFGSRRVAFESYRHSSECGNRLEHWPQITG